MLERVGDNPGVEAVGHGRDVPGGEVISTFEAVLMTWVSVFWTPASSENSHHIIVQEMAILPTPTNSGTEPSNSRYMAFPENQSSSENSYVETQVANEVNRPSAQGHS